jgi:quinol monooxygenase YgiN
MTPAPVAFPDQPPGETEPYSIWGTLKAKPGKGDVLAEKLLALVEPSRSEPGAIEYHVHRDRQNPDQFALYEVWESSDAFRTHVATPHVQKFLSEKASFMDGDFDARFVKMISEPETSAH